MTAFGRMRRWAFGISDDEVSFERRGFTGSAAAREHLEGIARTFLRGYHAAMLDERPMALVGSLELEPGRRRGFAYEGAAMSLAIRDIITPWRRRLEAYLRGPGAPHIYMVHVGAGWAFGRLRIGHRRVLDQLDPLLRWLAFDGYGFHEGFFHWETAIRDRAIPNRLDGYERRAFTQGLGRSLWFVKACDADRIAGTIASFDQERRADLWSGVGLACTYAGGVAPSTIERLYELAAGFEPCLAQGAAFAAKARQRAGNRTDDAEAACRIICDCSAEEAAAVTDVELDAVRSADAEPAGDEPAFESWRRRIQERFCAGAPSAQAQRLSGVG